uniref:Peptidase S1 domain-containing protein n=1 Tax=Panagrolaimus sp. PS1159 TaxID=55785 RepID=A0AC35GMZ7_9BILA
MVCGISPSIERYTIYNSNRILGGDNAKDGDWPWYALLNSGSYLCGSTIINDKWILTAAHCIDKKSSNASIRYGSVNITAGEVTSSNCIFVHPGYSKDNTVDDIALIKLHEPLKFFEKVQPICLDHNVEPHTNEILAQAGFGNIFKQYGPDGAEFILPKILQDGPTAYKGNSTSVYPICDVKYCVGGINHAALSGDSGGPLMAIRENRWIQIGIASEVIYRSVGYNGESISMQATNTFTIIANYCDWIKQTTNSEINC